jgi:hypothetical protein
LSILDTVKALEQEVESFFENGAAKVEAAAQDIKMEVEGLHVNGVKYISPTITSDMARALKDITPSSWDPAHPAADLYAKARKAIEAFEKVS